MHLSNAQLLELKKRGAKFEAADDDDAEEVTLEKVLVELVKTQALIAKLLSRPDVAPQIHVAPPQVHVAAPKVTVAVPPPAQVTAAKGYSCKHLYDRDGDLKETVITALD